MFKFVFRIILIEKNIMLRQIWEYYIILIIAIVALDVEASNANIVISSCEEYYRIVATKDGEAISEVKSRKEIYYEATRTEGHALALEYYDDYTKINKASAPGAEAEYRHWIPEDIFYTDSKVCYLIVPIKKVGKPVKVVFEKTYTKAEHFVEVCFPEVHDVKSKVVKIEVPQSLINKIKIVEKSFTAHISRRVEDGKKGAKIYVYEITEMDTPKEEEDSPEVSTIIPRIYIVGQYPTLGDLYHHLYGLTTMQDLALDKVKAQAMEITSGCANEEEKIRNILAWVQDRIRYIAIEHGEYGTRPDLASEVLRKRYGDCKGMSMLLKQMLIAVGFDARLVWIGTDNVGATWSEVPTLASGNHMICAVVKGDSILYLDGTASYLPVGIYHSSIQGREAMIENGDSYLLKTVPVQSPNKNLDRTVATYRIENNDLVGEISRTLKGIDKMAVCATYHDVDASNQADLLSKIVVYPKVNVNVSNANIKGCSTQSDSVQISAQVGEIDACNIVNGKIYVDLMPLRSHSLNIYDLKTRKRDISLPYCNRCENEVLIEIPEGYKVQSLPEKYEVNNEWFSASIVYDMKDEFIKCSAYVELKDITIAHSDASTWNKLVREFNQKNREQIVLTLK